MSQPAVEVDHVWKKFRKGELFDSLRDLIPAMAKRLVGRGLAQDELHAEDFWALRDVSFKVNTGESLGIIGPNGAGKSTMLKVLSKIMRPNRGTCRIQGRVTSLIEVGAGFHPDLTGRENIYLNGAILGMTRAQIREREEQIIEFAGVGGFIQTPVKRYSSGMRARLGFAVAAHLEPDVLLVDEVLSVGDARFRRKCVNRMQEMIQSDVTVVFISHILEQVRALCPRTVVLDHGSVTYDGPTDGAIRKYLDLLAAADPTRDTGEQPVAELEAIRFCDPRGEETIEWAEGDPGVIRMDLLVREPLREPGLVINISTIGGQWLGVSNAVDSIELPREPGRYTLEYRVEPNPFASGDYALDFVLTDLTGASGRDTLWQTPQPRVVTISGSHIPGVRCQGAWSVTDAVRDDRAGSRLAGAPERAAEDAA